MTQPREIFPYRDNKVRDAKDFTPTVVKTEGDDQSFLDLAGATGQPRSVPTVEREPSVQELAVIAAEEDPEILVDELLKE